MQEKSDKQIFAILKLILARQEFWVLKIGQNGDSYLSELADSKFEYFSHPEIW